MASAALSFFASPATAKPAAAIFHNRTQLPRPNLGFFTSISSSSSYSFSNKHAVSSTPNPPFSFVTKFSASEAPAIESEPDSEPAQISKPSNGDVPKGDGVFAVVVIGSRQYIVFPGRFITVQRLKGANVNDKIILNKVLLVGTKTSSYIGKPIVTNAAVHAVVEDQGLDPKVIVFKYKKKKGYRRNIGHRQPNTRIRITGITGYQDYPVTTLDS